MCVNMCGGLQSFLWLLRKYPLSKNADVIIFPQTIGTYIYICGSVGFVLYIPTPRGWEFRPGQVVPMQGFILSEWEVC